MKTLTQSKVTRINPIVILLIALAAGSFAAIFMKAAQNAGMPSHLIAAGRMLLAALALTPLVIQKYRPELRRLDRRDLLMSMFAGFWLASHFLMLVSALETTSIMIFTVFLNTGPLWVALLERTFLKVKLSLGVWIGLFITISGSVFIALTANNGNQATEGNMLTGIILTLIAAIAGSIYMIIGRSIRSKISLVPYIWIVFGMGGILGFLFVFATGTPLLGLPTESYFWLIALTIVAQLIGHSGFNYVLAFFPATMLSLSWQIMTITAAFAAFLIFGEVPTMMHIIGSGIIACGVVVAILARQRQAKVI